MVNTGSENHDISGVTKKQPVGRLQGGSLVKSIKAEANVGSIQKTANGFDGQDSPSGNEKRRIVRYKSVEANARFTAALAALLLVLLFVEGITLLKIANLIQVHVFIGMVLIPVVVLKIGSTTYRFIKYYAGHKGFQQKGPPVILLRVLGPFLVILTLVLLITGFALLEVPLSMRNSILFLHKASFVLWFIAMAVHVLGHLSETIKFAPKDYYLKTRRQLKGAGLRQWTIAAGLAVGVLLGALMIPNANRYFSAYFFQSHKTNIGHIAKNK